MIRKILQPSYQALIVSAGILASTAIYENHGYTIATLPIAMGFIGVFLICRSIEGLKDKD
jgi:hypothetical protein